jgi:acyl CoA:acetate/3-ketoacid CoA transferase beta subunit
MDNKELIAKRVALELRPGNLVNLGIGLHHKYGRWPLAPSKRFSGVPI